MYPQQQAAPQGWPQPQPNQQVWPQPGQQPAGEQYAPMVDAPTGGGPPKPSLRHLNGRAVALIGQRIDVVPSMDKPKPGEAQKMVKQVTYDVVIIDGGPLQWGDAIAGASQGRPVTQMIESVPALLKGCVTSNVNIVRALESYIGQRVPVRGRVTLGQSTSGNSRPWNLVPLDPQDPALQMFAQVFGQLAAGTFANPPVLDINGGPDAYRQQPAGSTLSTPVQQQMHGPMPPATQVPPGGAGQWPQPVPAVPQVNYGMPAGPPPLQQQGQPMPPAGGGGQLMPPAGWSMGPQMWAQLTPEQQVALGGTPF
jgi:hypothetical protein